MLAAVVLKRSLSGTSQQYFSLRTNQPAATSQQYFSLRTNQHQPSEQAEPREKIELQPCFLIVI
jgi:hypothetical protein